MPRPTKARIAACARWKKFRESGLSLPARNIQKKVKNSGLQFTPSGLVFPPVPPPLPMATGSISTAGEPHHDLELSVEEELEPTVEINIKQEPLTLVDEIGGEVEMIPLMMPPDEVKVEVEMLEQQDSCLVGEFDGLDPFHQPDLYLIPPERDEDPEQLAMSRCQFCLKQFPEAGQNAITQSKIEFVLGLSGWGTPGRQPACCEGCRKMFDLFYEFKRSCLVALARPAELLVWAGAKDKDSAKAKKKKAILIKSQREQRKQPAKSKTEYAQGIQLNSPEVLKPSTKPLPKATSQEDFKKPSFECEICKEQFSDRLVLKKHWLNHFFTASDISVTKLTTPERPTEFQPSLSADPTTPAPEPAVLVTMPERSIDLPNSEAILNLPALAPASSTVETKADDKEQQKTYCGRCRKRFSTNTIYIHHKPYCVKFKMRPEPEFACPQCPQKFRREQDLTYHINRHNGVRSVPCRREGCTKMFFSPKNRCGHERYCGPGNDVICSVCGSIFKSDGALRTHSATHGEPQFSCDICNKLFYLKSHLKKHAATHSDERKFPCQVCGKRFKSYEANRVHQRIHTQEKPYACHICDQRFTYNCLLKTHLEKGHDPV